MYTRFYLTAAIALFFEETYATELRNIHPDQDMALLDSLALDIGLAPGVRLIDDPRHGRALLEQGSQPPSEAFNKVVFMGMRHLLMAVDAEGAEQQIGVFADKGEADKALTNLNALLAPVQVLVDISGGALHGTWANRPASVLYISSDSDDVCEQEREVDNMIEDCNGNLVASWHHESEADLAYVAHYFDQQVERAG